MNEATAVTALAALAQATRGGDAAWHPGPRVDAGADRRGDSVSCGFRRAGQIIATDGTGYLSKGSHLRELDNVADTDWLQAHGLIEAQTDKNRARRSA
jgi:hypothetical protein